MEAANGKQLGACILVDQVMNVFRIMSKWSETRVHDSIILRNLSTRAYEHIRSEGIQKLPSRCTLQRFLVVSSSEVGFTSLVQQPLQAEVLNLQTEQNKICAL